MSPTQISVWLLDGQHAVGTGGVVVAGEARNPVLTTCVRVGGKVDRSRMSIVLLLRSARKYLLSTGSTQLMSNEKKSVDTVR